MAFGIIILEKAAVRYSSNLLKEHFDKAIFRKALKSCIFKCYYFIYAHFLACVFHACISYIFYCYVMQNGSIVYTCYHFCIVVIYPYSYISKVSICLHTACNLCKH